MPTLADQKSCTGCTACASVCPNGCIHMMPDPNGFCYPVITSSSCVQCGLCEQVCPVLTASEKGSGSPEFYAAFTKEEPIRMDSSSGGIFTELAQMILQQQGVVYGATYDDRCAVHHVCIERTEDLAQLRGAKYAQSDLQNSFREILTRLQTGQDVLFCGTPCQVAGLRSFLRKDYEHLYCVDFVCHGVPSPMAWREYLAYRAKLDGEDTLPTAINLRSKITGWSRYHYSNLFRYGSGKEVSSLSSDNLFMQLFVEDYINRDSCADCHFKGYHRCSDITLGDFWGIWEIAPEMDDNKGTSVVLVQSDRGKRLWSEISNKVVCKSVTAEQASQYNPSMIVSSTAKTLREEVLNEIRKGEIGECTRLFVRKPPSLPERVRRKLSSFRLRIQNGKGNK